MMLGYAELWGEPSLAVCGARLRSLRKFMLLLGLFEWKSCACSLWLPPDTLSREVLKVELGLLWEKIKGPLATPILRVWDGRPRRPVDGGSIVISGEGLPSVCKGGDRDQLPLEPHPHPFSLGCWVGVVLWGFNSWVLGEKQ